MIDFSRISFQSLLSWKYNQIILFFPFSILWQILFQSLLSWKYNQIHAFVLKKIFPYRFNPCYLGNTIRSCCTHSCNKTLSFAFQSLLSWKYNQIAFDAQVFDLRPNSFNPCYLGNTIRSAFDAQVFDFQPNSFNPCYLGNTIRSFILSMSCVICFGCFNPCYLGNTIRSLTVNFCLHLAHSFQSLLSWKYNQIFTVFIYFYFAKFVSILVILEIQSDLHC